MSKNDAKIQDINSSTLAEWLKKGEAFLVDVRENSEHEGAHIEGSLLNPLSRFDPAACTPDEGQKLVLYCGSGMRSRKAGKQLIASGHGGAFNLEGGIMRWAKSGYPVQSAG